MHYQANKSRKLNFAGADEAELDKALQESMKTFEAEDRARYGAAGGDDNGGGMVGSVLNRGRGDAPQAEAAKPSFQSFQGAGVSLGGAAAGGGASAAQAQMTDEELAIIAGLENDPELAAAML